MSAPFTLAVCSEMVFTDRPLVDRIRAIDELGFQVEIWDWTVKDIDALVATGATFSSMTGYVTGNLTDPDGTEELLATAEQSIPVAARLGIPSWSDAAATPSGRSRSPTCPVAASPAPGKSTTRPLLVPWSRWATPARSGSRP